MLDRLWNLDSDDERRLEIVRGAQCEGEITEKKFQSLEQEFGLQDKAFLKGSIRDRFLSELFSSKNHREMLVSLSSSGKAMIDVNGLKSINDLFGHETGDVLLWRICHALRYGKTLQKFIQEYGLEISIVREGGDEFSYWIRRNSGSLLHEIETESFNEQGENTGTEIKTVIQVFRNLVILEIVEQKLKEVDFSNPETIERLGELGRDFLAKINGAYEFPISVAIGVCTLDEVLLQYIRKHNIPTSVLFRNWVCYNLMGATQNLADKKTSANKAIVKEALWTSDDPRDQLTAYLITRSEDARRLYAIILKIIKSFKELEAALKLIQKIVPLKPLAIKLAQRKMAKLSLVLKKAINY